MTARERILSIRLLEKQEKRPNYTQKLGLCVTMKKKKSIDLK